MAFQVDPPGWPARSCCNARSSSPNTSPSALNTARRPSFSASSWTSFSGVASVRDPSRKRGGREVPEFCQHRADLGFVPRIAAVLSFWAVPPFFQGPSGVSQAPSAATRSRHGFPAPTDARCARVAAAAPRRRGSGRSSESRAGRHMRQKCSWARCGRHGMRTSHVFAMAAPTTAIDIIAGNSTGTCKASLSASVHARSARGRESRGKSGGGGRLRKGSVQTKPRSRAALRGAEPLPNLSEQPHLQVLRRPTASPWPKRPE